MPAEPSPETTAPLLVVIGGPPATGKTTLGKRLGADLSLPFVHKDGIKEVLFDRMGSRDRDWSRTLGLVSYDLLYYFLEAQLATRKSCIVESNFSHQHAAPVFAVLRKKYGFHPFQIQCQCDGQVLFDRFVTRSLSGSRHKGHNDDLAHTEFAPVLRAGKMEPIAFDPPAEFVTVDTTDFDRVDYDVLLARLRDVLAPLPPIMGGSENTVLLGAQLILIGKPAQNPPLLGAGGPPSGYN